MTPSRRSAEVRRTQRPLVLVFGSFRPLGSCTQPAFDLRTRHKSGSLFHITPPLISHLTGFLKEIASLYHAEVSKYHTLSTLCNNPLRVFSSGAH